MTEVHKNLVLDILYDSYLEAVLFSNSDTDGEGSDFYLQDRYTARDFAPTATNKLQDDLKVFFEKNEPFLIATQKHMDWRIIGHMLYWNSNGYGVGFWDGCIKDDNLAEVMSLAASCDLASREFYVGNDGKIYDIY